MTHAIDYLERNGDNTDFMNPALSNENSIAFYRNSRLSTHEYIEYKVAMDAICSQEIESCGMAEDDFETMVAEMLSITL